MFFWGNHDKMVKKTKQNGDFWKNIKKGLLAPEIMLLAINIRIYHKNFLYYSWTEWNDFWRNGIMVLFLRIDMEVTFSLRLAALCYVKKCDSIIKIMEF